jgi:tetratricopeptide (TPR) repeat protein
MDPEKSTAIASLLNLSAMLFFVPLTLLIAGLSWFVLNSPLGTPVVQFFAQRHFQAKRYRKAASLYERLYHFHELMGGKNYARQAAVAHEMSGDLKAALKHYELAEDWGKLGQLQMESGQLEAALESFTRGKLPARLVLCHEQLLNFYQAAVIYEHDLHQLHKARIFYERAESTNDPITQTLASLALVRIDRALGRQEESNYHRVGLEERLKNQPMLLENPEIAAAWAALQAKGSS